MSIHKLEDGLYKIRWREGAQQKLGVHGSFELAKKVGRKKMSMRDENRHLDIRREVNTPALQRDAPHHGEGCDDLVIKGNSHWYHSGRPS